MNYQIYELITKLKELNPEIRYRESNVISRRVGVHIGTVTLHTVTLGDQVIIETYEISQLKTLLESLIAFEKLKLQKNGTSN